MKNIILAIIVALLGVCEAFSQAKKPTIMVVPADSWCDANGFMLNFDNQGETVSLPDYRTALIKNMEIGSVITTIGGLMSERGFDLMRLDAALKKVEQENARKSMTDTDESPLDMLYRTAKADFIIQVTWKVNSIGPKKSVYFELAGIDPYTSKQKASAPPTTSSPLIGAPLTKMLSTAVLSQMDNFNSQLFSSFEDMQANGREGVLIVEVANEADYNLETEFELKGRSAELKRIINSFWMTRNTLNGRFSQDQASAMIQKFSQVRIPLYGDDGWGGQMAYDFDAFGNLLADFLKKEFGINTSIDTRGLGQVNLILGGK